MVKSVKIMSKDRQTRLQMIVLHKSGFVQEKCVNLATEINKPVRVAQKSIFLPLPQGE